MQYNVHGEEILDDTPVAMPIGFQRPPSLQDQIRRMIRSEQFNYEMEKQGNETFEESEDFECGDESFDPTTPYELDFDPAEQREFFKQSQTMTEEKVVDKAVDKSAEPPKKLRDDLSTVNPDADDSKN